MRIRSRAQHSRPELIHAGPGRSRSRLILFVLVAAVVIACGCVLVMVNTTPRSAAGEATGPAGAVATATSAVQSQGSPDAVVAAFDHGEVTHVDSVGESRGDADTPFYIGSLSKSLTAAVVARLVDRGEPEDFMGRRPAGLPGPNRLELDSPVVEYLPEFRVKGAYDQITIRHLLNQTSGLPTSAGMSDLTRPGITLEERIAELSQVELVSAPGEVFHYCNKNFALLAMVIQAATGDRYADVLQREVIRPLSLSHTYTDPNQIPGQDVSQGHTVLFGAHLPASTEHFPAALADGYVISTAGDLAILADVLVTGEHLGERYLSERMIGELQTPPPGVAPDPEYGTSYGFGLRTTVIERHPALWHEGELASAHADLGVFPDSRTGLVVLTTHNSQLFSGDAPFLAGMHALAGGATPASADGGYRMIALSTTTLAGFVLAAIAVDVSTWRSIVRRSSRRHRILVHGVGRLLAAGLIVWGLLFGVGSKLGLPGAIPVPVVWAGATDLTAIVCTVAGYLLVSAAVLSAATGRASQTGTPAERQHSHPVSASDAAPRGSGG